MNKTTKLAMLASLLILASCSDSKHKKAFISGCQSSAPKSFCSCVYDGIERNFSKEELDAMDRTGVIPQKFNDVTAQVSISCLGK